MIVYHGSNMIVDHPDVSHSIRDLDFGRGPSFENSTMNL